MVYRNHFTRTPFFQPVLQAPLFPEHMSRALLDDFAGTLPANRQAGFKAWVEHSSCVSDDHRKQEQVATVLLDLQEQHLREDHERITRRIEDVEAQLLDLQNHTQLKAERHRTHLKEQHLASEAHLQREHLTLRLAVLTSQMDHTTQHVHEAHAQANLAFSRLGLPLNDHYTETLRAHAPYRPLQDHHLVPQHQPHQRPAWYKRLLHEAISWLYATTSMFILLGGKLDQISKWMLKGDLSRVPWPDVITAMVIALGLCWFASNVVYNANRKASIKKATQFHTAAPDVRGNMLRIGILISHGVSLVLMSFFILADASFASVGLLGEHMHQQTSDALLGGDLDVTAPKQQVADWIWYMVAAFFMTTMVFKRAQEGQVDGEAWVAHQKTLETRQQAEIHFVESPAAQQALEAAAQWESSKQALQDFKQHLEEAKGQLQHLNTHLETQNVAIEQQVQQCIWAETLQIERLKAEHQTLLLQRENLHVQHLEFVANLQQAVQQSAQYAAHTHALLMGIVQRHHRLSPTFWQRIISQLVPGVAVKA